MSTLRSRLIHLASRVPSLRAHVLPLLRTATPTLHPFDRSDWRTFSGSKEFADGTDPLILYVNFDRAVRIQTRLGESFARSVVVIADGWGITAEYADADDGPFSTYTLNAPLVNQDEARAKVLRALPLILRGEVPPGFKVSW